ncbi:hypothetical protein UFOVP395_187 [uncultured Caudovirales phage]|jgi:hypothetical protein|uniref:Uncharacterized protein n=1 Tax=uncultured Caudovirales phage TaxID=2100421 RepID=A0A6J5M3Q9_9CAUD|nr:hypothetical protein UFOVP395_187 [uncultured Caudovirales phage]
MKEEPPILQIVPERVIKDAALVMEQEEKNNSFIYALETGKIFRDNDLTPVYLLDEKTMSIYVTSKQRLKKKFH